MSDFQRHSVVVRGTGLWMVALALFLAGWGIESGLRALALAITGRGCP